ncbi:hypothetical protein [Pyrococcus kukulkanii]|uniref:hypothetical protein n=1 Tax=Pyrococcus kukulkanii TaxID=1609559 RepID=UPI00356531D3
MDSWVGGILLISVLILTTLIFWKRKSDRYRIVRGVIYIIAGMILWKAGWNVNPIFIIMIPGISIIAWDVITLKKEYDQPQ